MRAILCFDEKGPEWLDDLFAVASASWPVGLANLSTYAFPLADLVVVGHMLGPTALAAACLCLVVVNLALEPAIFIMHNAVTSLCAYAIASQNTSQLHWHIRAAVLFCALLALPLVGLVLATPVLLIGPFALHVDVASGLRSFAPAYSLSIAPALLLAALQGFLRAHGQHRSTALLCWMALVPNVGLALHLVPQYGLRGSAYTMAATRVACVLVLGLRHCDALRRPASARGGGLRAPLLYLAKDFAHSWVPVSLRVGIAQLIALIAVVPAVSGLEGSLGASQAASAFALTSLLLQAAASVCMGVQQATIMLVTRHVSLGRVVQAQHTMRLAGLLLLGLCVTFGVPCYAFRDHLGALFIGSGSEAHESLPTDGKGGSGGSGESGRADLVHGLSTLAAYLGPMLVLKTSAGLYGLFFAVTGRGAIGTWILLLAHGCFGLPAAYCWAAERRGGAEPLMQAHALAWLLAALAFAAAYLWLPTTEPQGASQLSDAEMGRTGSSRGSSRGSSTCATPLARPLLGQDGQPSAA